MEPITDNFDDEEYASMMKWGTISWRMIAMVYPSASAPTSPCAGCALNTEVPGCAAVQKNINPSYLMRGNKAGMQWHFRPAVVNTPQTVPTQDHRHDVALLQPAGG